MVGSVAASAGLIASWTAVGEGTGESQGLDTRGNHGIAAADRHRGADISEVRECLWIGRERKRC